MLYDRTGTPHVFPEGSVVWSRPMALSTISTDADGGMCSGAFFLADLHHVQAITTRPWATTPPPSSRQPAGIFASHSVGQAAWEFPNSNARDIAVTRSCLLYAGWTGNNTCRSDNRQAHHLPILGRVSQPLSPVPLHDACAGSFRQLRSQDWSVNHLRLVVAELLSAGSRPQRLPIPDACCVVLAPLFKYHSLQRVISRAVRGRAPLKRGALRRILVTIVKGKYIVVQAG